jgi:long-chain acyl-CoA synthetase
MTVLLTGATGFLGMEVLARLIEDGDSEIVAVVRARDREHARGRIEQTLATLYEQPPNTNGRLLALAGDLTAEDLGLTREERKLLRANVSSVLHCAASVDFDLPLPEAHAINVTGTARVLDLAADLPSLERIVHVSTAYVAGRLQGVFDEDELDRGQGFRNSYERSKFNAERLVAARTSELPIVVARPSIVVGDSRSGWTPAFNVIYWPLQAFARGLIRDAPVDPDGLLDVVGVDYVADALVQLLRGPVELGRAHHLVAGTGVVTNRDLVELACTWLGREPPPLRPAAAVSEQVLPYLPYFDVAVRFDDRRARAALAPAGIRAKPLPEFFATLMAYAERSRWGKRPSTRERAAAAVG